MPKRLLVILIATLCGGGRTHAQQCDSLGQTPTTAFPVCGSSVFQQNQVPICVNGTVPSYCPSNGNVYQDLNPFWYKFTCFTGGTLGFIIKPNVATDDYDWCLFDITGLSPNMVYTDTSSLVAYNWSGVTGNTGTNGVATSLYECGSIEPPAPPTSPPPFSKMPTLIQGHSYLLMISHFSGFDQSGYALSFGGGTASITDTLQPALLGASAGPCAGKSVIIALNKNMLCSSLTGTGSDFTITPASASIISAVGNNCMNGFDMDTVVLTFSTPLPQGSYTITAVNGTDGNTLLDVCSRPIPVGESVQVNVPAPPSPVPLDSMTPPTCTPSSLQLVFSTPIDCSSIAADGSDFRITGPSAVTITGATGNCASGFSSTIQLQLGGPIIQGGAYQLVLQNGSDGNTIIDQCGEQTPAGSTLNFTVADTVSAAIQDQVDLGCGHDTIFFANAGGNGIDSWQWYFNDSVTSGLEDVERIYTVYGPKTAALVVSNGVCSDSGSVSVSLDNILIAKFEATNTLCPKDQAIFSDSSVGAILAYAWNFGDGTSSSASVPPPHEFPQVPVSETYNVLLTITDSAGCTDTASQPILVVANCYIAVPSAFTPNGDGINDYLYPLNAYKATDLDFRVYNRYGQLVFETENWQVRWDGTINGAPAPVGAYVWTLRYTNIETGEKVVQKGTSVLIR